MMTPTTQRPRMGPRPALAKSWQDPRKMLNGPQGPTESSSAGFLQIYDYDYYKSTSPLLLLPRTSVRVYEWVLCHWNGPDIWTAAVGGTVGGRGFPGTRRSSAKECVKAF